MATFVTEPANLLAALAPIRKLEPQRPSDMMRWGSAKAPGACDGEEAGVRCIRLTRK